MTLAAQAGLRVDNILARGVAIKWDEAVALVQAASRQVLITGAQGFPTAAQTVLYREGTVVALATTEQPQVRGAAHLLASVLGDDVPVRLRLLVSQAAGADATYASLAEFSDALAYFERPDPANLLRELFLRADAVPAPAAGTVQPPPGPVAPTQAPKPPVSAKVKKGSRWPIVAAAAVILACLVVWLLGGRFGGISALVADSATTVSEPPAATPPAAAKGAKESQRAAAVPSGLATAHRSSASISNAAKWAGEADLLFTPDSQRGKAGAPIPLIERSERVIGPYPPVVYAYYDVPATIADAVYSKGDADVVPPQSVYPKLPSDPPGTQAGNRTVLELLIAADGLVERVRLRTPPRNIHEFMLVSAAKAWRFDPATFHGRPVRFLHNVAITFPH